MKFNICSYVPLRVPLPSELNLRFAQLYKAVCQLQGGGGSGYILPPATDSTLGGVIVGDGLSIDGGGVLSVDAVGGENFANANLTFTADRSHDGDGFGLSITNLSNFEVSSSSNFNLIATDGGTININSANLLELYSGNGNDLIIGSSAGLIVTGSGFDINVGSGAGVITAATGLTINAATSIMDGTQQIGYVFKTVDGTGNGSWQPDINIYEGDGALTGDRIVDTGSNVLLFRNAGAVSGFGLDSTNFFVGNGGVGTAMYIGTSNLSGVSNKILELPNLEESPGVATVAVSVDYMFSDTSGNILTQEFLIGTADAYVLVVEDQNRTREVNEAGDNTIVVDDTSLAALPDGGRINICQFGTGQTQIVTTGSAVLLSAGGADKIANRYGWATVIKRSPTQFYLVGDITT